MYGEVPGVGGVVVNVIVECHEPGYTVDISAA